MSDIFYLRAEDFTKEQQRQIYVQYRKAANRRLERRRAENNVVYANKRVSQFLKRKGYKYFPSSNVLDEEKLATYLNEMLLYVQDRTSLAAGIKEVKEERLRKFQSDSFGHPLVGNVTAKDLDKILRSEEFEILRGMYEYELLLEDFTAEIERGHSAERVIEDWRKFMENEEMSYNDYRKMLNRNFVMEQKRKRK